MTDTATLAEGAPDEATSEPEPDDPVVIPPYYTTLGGVQRNIVVTDENLDEAISMLGLYDVSVRRSWETGTVEYVDGLRPAAAWAQDNTPRRVFLRLGDVVAVGGHGGEPGVIAHEDPSFAAHFRNDPEHGLFHSVDLMQALDQFIGGWLELDGVEVEHITTDNPSRGYPTAVDVVAVAGDRRVHLHYSIQSVLAK